MKKLFALAGLLTLLLSSAIAHDCCLKNSNSEDSIESSSGCPHHKSSQKEKDQKNNFEDCGMECCIGSSFVSTFSARNLIGSLQLSTLRFFYQNQKAINFNKLLFRPPILNS